ncbi:rhomboid family intramembrane serine protease [Cognatishimia sp. F0-27]|uniref:rhomboid family intramembrane serine protease n=1 Tax=Cognatishimia sp. F0-27 TaxID=2816855 RepID=UPI001D0C909E|nr:rhomboid family intramembrane serine protease [Cognatishimia sp. F0-27]MCC1494345.1 rhomboid family intramembrane serine protease [Cognatishimia sp. F0-27]
MLPIRDHNPSGRTPYITYALMIANIAIFVWTLQYESDQRALAQLYFDYALIPALISEGQGFEGIVTSMFLHGGFMHLAGNMLFLFIFGDNMEDEMGHVPFLVFYLAAGVGAGLLHYLSEPYSQVPTIGASGAIAGVMGGYLLLFPKARIDILIILVVIFKILPLPAWIVLAVWFAMQLFGGFSQPADMGGVAYWAHAGGFLVGLVLTVPIWLRRGGPRFWVDTEGHPPHPEAQYRLARSAVPRVPRR